MNELNLSKLSFLALFMEKFFFFVISIYCMWHWLYTGTRWMINDRMVPSSGWNQSFHLDVNIDRLYLTIHVFPAWQCYCFETLHLSLIISDNSFSLNSMILNIWYWLWFSLVSNFYKMILKKKPFYSTH